MPYRIGLRSIPQCETAAVGLRRSELEHVQSRRWTDLWTGEEWPETRNRYSNRVPRIPAMDQSAAPYILARHRSVKGPRLEIVGSDAPLERPEPSRLYVDVHLGFLVPIGHPSPLGVPASRGRNASRTTMG